MTEATRVLVATPAAEQRTRPWTCPFCALLCDRFGVTTDTDGSFALVGSRCPRALRSLEQFSARAEPANATIDGAPVSLDAALDAAAQILARARQPLFAGLATDLAGARALYRLGSACHAIFDHAHGETMLAGLRALQDRGAIQTTLAEIRSRADLLVCLGTQPSLRYPEFFRRVAPAADTASPDVVFLGVDVDPALGNETACRVDLQGDWFQTLSILNALARKHRLATKPPALAELVEQLFAARYAVLVWEPAALPGTQVSLLVESINDLLKTLNRSTRAGGLALAGNDGALSFNQALTWMSGLPLRTGLHANGLEHEPHRYASHQLLSDSAADALLWVSAFGAELKPPPSQIPTVVLGHPALSGAGSNGVFIPVSTPGIGSAGHLTRVDGVVVVPLTPLFADSTPTVATIAARLLDRVKALRS